MAIIYETYPQDDKLVMSNKDTTHTGEKKIKPIWKKVFVLLTCLSFYFAYNSSSLFGSGMGSFCSMSSTTSTSSSSNCPSIKPLSPSFENSSVDKILHDPEFKKQAIEKFSGAIKIDTEVQDNNPPPKENRQYWSQFTKFQDYLKQTFPLTFANLNLDIVNEFGMVLTWEGSDSELKPMMLTAHQDVVPVNPSTVDQWTYPPYSGAYDKETDTIWGRGSFDCKNLLIGELQAVETLLKDGFHPTRTVLVVFGFDEESSGVHGATTLSKFLLEKYGSDSIYSIVDEGFGIIKVSEDIYMATPITGEKGHLNSLFEIKGHGGHSSSPPMSGHTNIGVAAKLISLLEDTPFEATYTPENPVWNLLTCLAEHSSVFDSETKRVIKKSGTSPKYQKILLEFLLESQLFKELVRTSQAVDIINGGVKSNALPEEVSFVVNHRIEVGSSVQETINHDLDAAQSIADIYNYGLKYQDEFLLPETENGYIAYDYSSELEPAPVSPHNNSVWEVFSQSIQETYENGVFASSEKDISFYVTESLATFNTDTKCYWDLTRNIYRFQAVILGVDSLKAFHSVNEHIPVNDHLSTIAFVYNYILNVNEYKSSD
ncbi:hypothetical protein ACO0QE_002143 [Hanseniaspora vineae]